MAYVSQDGEKEACPSAALLRPHNLSPGCRKACTALENVPCPMTATRAGGVRRPRARHLWLRQQQPFAWPVRAAHERCLRHLGCCRCAGGHMAFQPLYLARRRRWQRRCIVDGGGCGCGSPVDDQLHPRRAYQRRWPRRHRRQCLCCWCATWRAPLCDGVHCSVHDRCQHRAKRLPGRD